MTTPDTIAIIDFGSPYTSLIAKAVRRAGVYSEVVPASDTERLNEMSLKGVILSGGATSIERHAKALVPSEVFDLNLPILGLGYGLVAIARHFGIETSDIYARELGPATVHVTGESVLLKGLKDRTDRDGYAALDVWMSHDDHIAQLPKGFEVIATHPRLPIAGIADRHRRMYGLQFHPEVQQGEHGDTILRRFVFDVCQCEPTWSVDTMIEQLIQSIREQVGEQRVLLALSGGVKSSVLAVLLHRALGDQLTCVFIDTGCMRSDEARDVLNFFDQDLGLDVVQTQAKHQFFKAMALIEAPVEKQQAFVAAWHEVFNGVANRLHNITWLAEGGTYERELQQINDQDVLNNIQLKTLRPFAKLFKHEVVKLGAELGLPIGMTRQHEFPIMGFAARVLGAVDEVRVECVRQADTIFNEELARHDLLSSVNQAFAIRLPIEAAGQVGDVVTYGAVIVLRAVMEHHDLSVQAATIHADVLQQIALRIMNEVKHVSRVVYDISNCPPALVEWSV